MFSLKGTGKVVDIVCDNMRIPEFPELLFGTHPDRGEFFDATNYLPKQSLQQLSVEDFFQKFDFEIRSVAKTYELKYEELVVINKQGHQLINRYLCYLFLSYIDPQFSAYIFETMDELFLSGMVISDTYLITLIKKRISHELLNQFLVDGTL